MSHGGNGWKATGNRNVRIELPPRGWSLNAARNAVRDALTRWGLDDPEHLVELVATELVSNAVRHVSEDFCLSISADGAVITLTVQDPSPEPPVRRTPDQRGGRGLSIVEAVAASWGVDNVRDDGKRVWARLDLR
jgi:anti-sigma regulatory factor (Ser/Thr protein kinase)